MALVEDAEELVRLSEPARRHARVRVSGCLNTEVIEKLSRRGNPALSDLRRW
jgi:hypothetical protein